MMFLIAIIVTIFIIGCLYNKRAEREHEERHKREIENLREEAHRLFAAYPDVFYTRFQKSYGLLTEEELYKITSINDKSWELEQIEIDSKDDERYYKEWRRKQ